MARFLFVVPPLTGHVNPTVSVARELEARGQEVAWVGHPRKVRPLLPEGATLFELDDRVSPELYDHVTKRARTTRGLAGLKFLWEDFLVPLARAMRPGVRDAVDRFEPSVLVVDQQAVVGAIVARRREIPWATFTTTSAGVTDPMAGLPKVREWLDRQLDTLMHEAGLPLIEKPDRSPYLVVVFSTEALVGPLHNFPPHYAFVGPAISDRPQTTPFPWEELHDGPRVLVSLGTVNAERGERFYRIVVDAVLDEPLQVVLVAPEDMVPEQLPDNVIVCSYVPQLKLMPHMDAVVCHAGHNTVCEALAHGLPLVVTPITDDQPVVAQQVVDAGAGIRLKFARLRLGDFRDALHQVLHDERYRKAAERIQSSFNKAGGAPEAADRLVSISHEPAAAAADPRAPSRRGS